MMRAGRPLEKVISEERSQRSPPSPLANYAATAYCQSILEDLGRSNDVQLRELADGSVKHLMPEGLAAWNNDVANKLLVRGLHDAFKRDMSADQLKAICQSPEKAASDWLTSIHGSRYVYQWFTSQ